MSQLLVRLSRLSRRNHGSYSAHFSLSRLFSSTASSPYLAIGNCIKKHLADGSSIGDLLLFDPAKEQLVTIPNIKIAQQVAEGNCLVGISGRWGILYVKDKDVLLMNDYFNPSKTIPLLSSSLAAEPCHPKFVKNVAMSSDSPSEEDCVVAIKYLGNHISRYIPSNPDPSWMNIELPFTCFHDSNLSYSKRDECFCLPLPGSNCLCSIDPHFKDEDDIHFRELVFRNLPNLSQSEWELLDSCSRAQHWVDSSSGQPFLIQWYSYVSPFQTKDPIFMVFSEEETTQGKYMCYTKDIGDLTIFLSSNQPFCVVSSLYPGLEPNSIYVMSTQGSEDFGVYNLATRTYRGFEPPEAGPLETSFQPYWVPPFSV